MTATLVTHCGARPVTREELDAIQAPPGTETWFPISHGAVLSRALTTLTAAGFTPRRTTLAVARNDARFFGTIDLETPVVSGVSLAVGLRSSTDKSLPLSFCAGNRVFVCDNLAFRSEITVARKHTRHGEDRFAEAICRAVQSLGAFQVSEAARIEHFQETGLADRAAESLMLRAAETGIVSYPMLPDILREWRTPSFSAFEARTLWSLENAFTTPLGNLSKRNPQRFCALTVALHDLLAKEAGMHSGEPQLAAAA